MTRREKKNTHLGLLADSKTNACQHVEQANLDFEQGELHPHTLARPFSERKVGERANVLFVLPEEPAGDFGVYGN